MRKKNKSNNSRGTVTIFLTLILVPCLIFTCAFGDVSRVQLSQSQANAAADLALYSLMSNYDVDLKEWYGLVASVQDIDQFYDITEKYFVGMMDANGIDGTSSQLFSSYLSSLKNGGEFMDFLQVDTANSVNVTAAENGEMGKNAALIEDGIVEFMKYRGPVEITSNIIERFNTLNVLKKLTEANDDQPIVEKKQKYTEAEGEMLEELLYSYIACVNYQDYFQNHPKLKGEEYPNYAEKLDCIRSDLQKVTELITEYYSYTDGIENISSSFPSFGNLPSLNSSGVSATYPVNGGSKTLRMSSIGAKKDPDDEESYIIEVSKLEKIVKKVDENIQTIENAAARITNAVSGLTAPEDANSDVNPALYCMKFQAAVSTKDLNAIKNAGNDLMKTYASILLAQECCWSAKDDTVGWSSKLESYRCDIENTYKNYLTLRWSNTQYQRLLNAYTKVATNTVQNVQERRYEFISEYTNTFCGKASVTIGDFFKCVREEFGDMTQQLDQQISNIDLIINGGKVTFNGDEYKVPSLDSLKDAIRKSQAARNAWGSEADAHNSDYAQQEQEEYHQEEAQSSNQVYAPQLRDSGEEEIEELRTRLLNIRAVCVGLRDALKSFTYGGESVVTLNRNNAIAAAKKQVPTDYRQVRTYLSQNAADAATYYRNLVKPLEQSIYDSPVIRTGKTGNDPDLNQDPPELFYYMRQTIQLEQLKDVTEQKKENEKNNSEYKEQAQQQSEASKDVENKYLVGLGSDLSNPYGGKGMSASTVITSLVGAVKTLVGGRFGEFRDQMYFCEYVMDMFSYSSYNNEGQYKIAAKSDKVLSLDDFSSEGKYGSPYIDTWEKLDLQNFTGNVSLTNHQINAKNNKANLAEVEYILFGNAKNEDNLKSAYGSIFTIREALNLISGFQNFYTTSTNTGLWIESIAAEIVVATAGIVPAPLTKCILIGVLATVETAHDLSRLKAGIPVAVYKAEEKNWWIKLDSDNFKAVLSGEGLKEPDDAECGIYYSEYLYLFLIIAANDSELYKDMLMRTGTLIEANMQQGAGDSDFDLDKSICYFTLTGTLEVKPLLITLPIVYNNVESDSYDQVRESTTWCTYDISQTRGYS